MGAFIDVTGQSFGRWRALSLARPSFWTCVCECGTRRDVYLGSLRSGVSKSCGCLNIEVTGARRRTHGMSGHPAYTSWLHMRARCLDPNCDDYERWGGRGIVICERWSTFEAFWEDMGPIWKPGLSIERTDNDGNYTPDNCIWANDFTQANNKRNNVWIETPKGPMTIAEAARAYGHPHYLIYERWKRGDTGDHLFRPARAIRRANREKAA